MLAIVKTLTLKGISARPLRVEADVRRGLPSFTVVGLPDAAVRECRERVRAALVNSGLEFPLRRVIVRLAPASLRRAAASLDLPIATAILCASGQLQWPPLSRVALTGELALDGTTRPLRGALPIAEAARDAGAEAIVVPSESAAEAALAEGIRVIGLDDLGQLPRLASGEWSPVAPRALPLAPAGEAPDLADLRGRPHLRRALEVAAAGGHPLLMVGPPGSGKSLAASRLPSILPPLSAGEALEVARIASACGRLGAGVRPGRPFRAPHHTISATGLIGGGTPPRAGEATLAHRGVLYLDQLEEFSREALEALQEPLQSGVVSITQTGRRRTLPGRFLLIAAANPCPCGRDDGEPDCSCAPFEVQRHQGKLAAALGGRIDIYVAVREPSRAEIAGPPGEPSASVRKRVCSARERQEDRLGSGRCNAEMTAEEAAECSLSDRAAALLDASGQQLCSSARGSVLRVAQTLSDLAGSVVIGGDEISEALALLGRDGRSGG